MMTNLTNYIRVKISLKLSSQSISNTDFADKASEVKLFTTAKSPFIAALSILR